MNVSDIDRLFLEEKLKEKIESTKKQKYRSTGKKKKESTEDKKKTYRKKLYSDKDKSISIQILEKYLSCKEKYHLLGVQKSSIRFTHEVLDFIIKHDLEITNHLIK